MGAHLKTKTRQKILSLNEERIEHRPARSSPCPGHQGHRGILAVPENYPDGLSFTWEFLGQQGSLGSTLTVLVCPEQASLNIVKVSDMAAAAKVLGIINL